MAASRARKPQRSNALSRSRMGLALGGALLVAALLVGVSVIGSRGSKRSADAQLTGVSFARATASGIPQHGFTLGSPHARLTIEEYADLQCPYCGRFATDVLPLVVDRYVRAGKAKLVFRPLAFVGPDSVAAARLAVAAARQDRLWQLVELLYRNQGQENTGWASRALLDSAALAVGADVQRAHAYAGGAAATAALAASAARASSMGVRSTPTLVLIRDGRTPLVVTNALDMATLFAGIDAALA